MCDETVNQTTVNRCAIKLHKYEDGKENIEDESHCGQPVSVTDAKHRQKVDKFTKVAIESRNKSPPIILIYPKKE